MRTVSYTCDRCGEAATARVSVTVADMATGMAHDHQGLDLCDACRRELEEWLAQARPSTERP